MKIRFWDLGKEDLLEVWGDDGMTMKELMKAVYRSVYERFEDGFIGQIGIEFLSETGEVEHELTARQTYVVDDLLHLHPIAVRFFYKGLCIRRMGLF